MTPNHPRDARGSSALVEVLVVLVTLFRLLIFSYELLCRVADYKLAIYNLSHVSFERSLNMHILYRKTIMSPEVIKSWRAIDILNRPKLNLRALGL